MIIFLSLSISLNQQSEYTLFYKLMCWLGINGMQETPTVIYLLFFLSSITIDVWLLTDEVSVSHTATPHSR